MGGKSYSRGKLYNLLSNPIYKGEIRHLKACHPGQHEAIIDTELWDQTQRLLAEHAVRGANENRDPNRSPLSGRLFDECVRALTPTHTVRQGRRHRYYVSRALLTEGASDTSRNRWRLPAKQIEPIVSTAAATLLEDKSALVTAIQARGIEADRIVPILEQATGWVQKLKSSTPGETLSILVDRVDLTASGFKLALRLPISENPSDTLNLERFIPLTMQKRGVELRLVIQNEPSARSTVDLVLLKTIARAHRWFDQLISGDAESLAAIAAREGLSYRFVGKTIRLAFLAPEIVEAIAEGGQPPELSTELLTKRIRLPLDWRDQKRLLNIN